MYTDNTNTQAIPRFDFKMFQASLAFCGLPSDWNKAFKRILLTDKETGTPITDEKTGKQKTTLRSCNASQESSRGNAVWIQVNEPFEGSAIFTNKYGTPYPKKAGNHEIHFIRNVTLDTEYPPDPDTAIAIGRKLVAYLISIGLVEADHPIEHSGAGPHVVLPIIPIETTPETAKLWNEAIAKVVKAHIKPEFDRLVKEAGIEMDLGGFDISRVLSPPGTWRPRNLEKNDCEALHQGVLRHWLEPYTDGNYPVRKESARLTQLIRDTFDQISDPAQWLYDYATTHPNSDRSAFFQSLVNATYLKFGENAVKQTKDLINSLAGDKYNGRLDQELERSLELAKRIPKQNNTRSNAHQSSPRQPDLETIIQRLGENEYGDGLLFAEIFNGQVCHDHSEKAWYLWNQHHWKKDTTGKIKQMVSGHLGSIYLKARGDVHKQMVDIQAEIETLQKENKEDEKLPKLKSRLGYLGALMEELEKRAKALRSANRMKNVLTFAMSEHNIGITGEIWDADPWLIGVTNGVVDLRTGECRDGYPVDYIRSVSPTKWTGLNTPCSRFERFLQEIFEVLPEAQLQKLTNGKYHELSKEEQERIVAEHRKKLIDFLKRLLGYSIAGLSTEAIFPIFYGEEGRNGKDTLFTLLRSVLGTAIANAVHNDVFLSADKGRTAGAATPHLADLQGKRIVWGSETKQGDRINVSQIKHLTGGGAIPARPPYGQLYTFDPTHTLFLMTNYKPHADARDKAFWSRACLIEFCLRFVDKPQCVNERKADTSLPRELEAEASGILALLVRSCLDYQQQGLNRPEIVELATESYRASEDNIQQFINECCVLGDNRHVGAKKLYDTYVSWCKDNNLNYINGKLFGLDMTKRFVKLPTRKGLEYQKIGILTDEIPPEDPFCEGSPPNCEGSKNNPSHPSEAASEAASGTIHKPGCEGCEGFNQEIPYSTPREDSFSPLYGSTLHTLHTANKEESIKQPLEPNAPTVKGQEIHFTRTFDPSHSLETFWAVGKQHSYPEIADLGLKSGMTGWNSFTLAHRIRIPDVIARLGGV